VSIQKIILQFNIITRIDHLLTLNSWICLDDLLKFVTCIDYLLTLNFWICLDILLKFGTCRKRCFKLDSGKRLDNLFTLNSWICLVILLKSGTCIDYLSALNPWTFLDYLSSLNSRTLLDQLSTLNSWICPGHLSAPNSRTLLDQLSALNSGTFLYQLSTLKTRTFLDQLSTLNSGSYPQNFFDLHKASYFLRSFQLYIIIKIPPKTLKTSQNSHNSMQFELLSNKIESPRRRNNQLCTGSLPSWHHKICCGSLLCLLHESPIFFVTKINFDAWANCKLKIILMNWNLRNLA
jgi:hypothetical protein